MGKGVIGRRGPREDVAADKGDGGNMAEGGEKIKIMFMEMIQHETTRRRQLKKL